MTYEGQNGFTPFLFTVLLSSPSPTDTVKVTYRTVDGTAHVVQDFNNATGTLVFPPQSDEGSIIVFVKADGTPEGDENFTLVLTNASKAILADTLARAVIRDDDGLTPVEPGLVPGFALERIFPNPASSSFRVDFSLGHESHVSVALLDVQGREIARLVEGVRAAGRHRAGWGESPSRSRLAAGIYFVRYQAAGHTAIRRLVVLD